MPDEGLGRVGAPRRPERHPVDRGPRAPDRRERAAVRQVDHQRGARPVGVDGAQARGEPRDAPARVRAAVERVEHDHDLPVGVAQARLLRQHADARLLEHPTPAASAARSLRYWPGTCRAAPSRRGRRARRGPPSAASCRSSTRASSLRASGVYQWAWQAGDVAAIDVAGFVSELKDHAIDHGFHVHDERHFVETYSLRQTWEVDLHPEEACGGPLDLHLSLEVDPRPLLAFEDLITGAARGVLAAEQIATADHIGRGRFGLNIVCGWNQAEFDMFGIEQDGMTTATPAARNGSRSSSASGRRRRPSITTAATTG